MSGTKTQLLTAIKEAMKARDKERLATLRLMSAEIKRVEVDSRQLLDDDDDAVTALFSKMVKQRQDSIAAFSQAGRNDLVAIETAEMAIITTFLPEPLSEAEVQSLIKKAIATTDASDIKDMGAVMAWLKPHLAGRTDMKQASALVRAQLA